MKTAVIVNGMGQSEYCRVPFNDRTSLKPSANYLVQLNNDRLYLLHVAQRLDSPNYLPASKSSYMASTENGISSTILSLRALGLRSCNKWQSLCLFARNARACARVTCMSRSWMPAFFLSTRFARKLRRPVWQRRHRSTGHPRRQKGISSYSPSNKLNLPISCSGTRQIS